jgi:UDP-N-acetylmuramoylalanine--D-glutamate ligase
VAAALELRARGEQVIGVDSGSASSPDLAAAARRLSAAGVEVQLDASDDALAAHVRTLIKSPGVPASAPLVAAARARGLPVLGELELGWRLLENEFVAVTGTNGKTTTTEWIGHIHREAALPVAVAGNVGTALTSLVGQLANDATVVCEASSFQLEDTEAFAPEVAVLLNLQSDHLDRHGSYADYVAAKLRVFAHQGNDDVAVAPYGLGIEDLGGCARRVCFGDEPGAELSARAGQLWWGEEALLSTTEISLPGEHNRANAMAAAAVCLARGIESVAVASGLRTFPGVAHRLELIAEVDGVAYVNDSKATNVASTLVALRSYAGGVHLIAGGRGKGQDFSPLAAAVAERCTAVYLIGEAAADLVQALAAADVPSLELGDLESALGAAAAAARPGDTILFSPACASFDQYKDFEARGEHFRALVEGL